jgi:hypothetical protein
MELSLDPLPPNLERDQLVTVVSSERLQES